jgi:hypothetical protein
MLVIINHSARERAVDCGHVEHDRWPPHIGDVGDPLLVRSPAANCRSRGLRRQVGHHTITFGKAPWAPR